MSITDLSFPWELLNAIIGGTSAIDVPALELFTEAEAESFLDCYGFTWKRTAHRRELERFRQEALLFIEEELLPDEPLLKVPEEIAGETDVRRLLVWASGDRSQPRQRWACALLRVMHTLAHYDSYFNRRFGAEIRAQVLSRFQEHLEETAFGLQLGSGEAGIPLARFDVKYGKSSRSVVMKLLHKAENVATDIFDRLGVRFVTRERFDALRVVRYLRSRNVIMFANVKPSRSRNSLIDLDWMRSEIESLQQRFGDKPAGLLAAVQESVRRRPLPPPDSSFDPHSSINYHAIQFTCRQLIRVPNPFVAPEGAMLALHGPHGKDSDAHAEVTELRFFFPFEVQILDVDSYEQSRSGLAAHDVYKHRQRTTIKRRVLGPLLRG